MISMQILSFKIFIALNVNIKNHNLNGGFLIMFIMLLLLVPFFSKTTTLVMYMETEWYRRWIFIIVNNDTCYFVPPQDQLRAVFGFIFISFIFLDLLDFENRVYSWLFSGGAVNGNHQFFFFVSVDQSSMYSRLLKDDHFCLCKHRQM